MNRKRRSPSFSLEHTERRHKRTQKSNADQSHDAPPSGGIGIASNAASQLLSSDLLHHIFGFFVSPRDGTVDGTSLLASALTCHRWKDAIYAPSLWSTAAVAAVRKTNHDSPSLEQTSMTNDLIYASLSIKEQESIGDLSLIGFTKLRAYKDTSSLTSNKKETTATTWYDAIARAQGIPCLLSISKSRYKTCTKSVIQELYQGHLECKASFLDAPVSLMKRKDGLSSSPHSSSLFPRGIAIIDRRLVRWYDGTFEERKAQLQPKRNSSCHTIRDIASLLELERTHVPSVDRPRLRMDHWATLVDWIIEIVECFNLQDATAYRAMSIIDRFLASTGSQNPLRRSQYQLVAGSALFLASQCCSPSSNTSNKSSTLTVNDISFCADNSYKEEQVHGTATLILQTLQWKLAIPTTLDFCQAYTQCLKKDDDSRYSNKDKTFWMIRQIAELALQTPVHLSPYPPSMIAACITVLAKYCCSDQSGRQEGGNVTSTAGAKEYVLWPTVLEQATGYSLQDLKHCCMELSGRLEEIRNMQEPNLIMISRRYRQASRGNVAGIPIPSLASFDLIANYNSGPPRQP